jgi:membrane protease YdiL (CAAX protease family)
MSSPRTIDWRSNSFLRHLSAAADFNRQASALNQPSRIHAWLSALIATAVFCILVGLGSALLQWLLSGYGATGIRPQVTLRLTGSVIGQVAAVLLMILYLRTQDHSLTDIGFGRPSSGFGWIAAGVLTVLFVGLMLMGPLRGRAPVAELSFFHLYNSVIAGLGAGFCEELVFRGFVMSVLSWAGVGRVTQVLASGLLFGLAHVGWTTLGAAFDPRLLLGPVIATTVLGMLYAGIYLLGKRSLTPVIASHTITDVIIEPWLLLAALSKAL